MPKSTANPQPTGQYTTSTRALRKRVLLVDQSADSRDVIRTVLERRGVEIYEAANTQRGLDIIRAHSPDVVVLDLEAEETADGDVRAAFDEALAAQPAEMVILGNLRQDQRASAPHVVPKPYYYGPLIQMIEQLVNARPAVPN